MFNYFAAARRLKKELRACQNERDLWRDEARTLRKKLDERSDFFIEREMRLVDRFLTSQVKTFAITDEVRAKQVTQEDVDEAALDAFMADKKAFLVECAKEAAVPNPEAQAELDFAKNYDLFRHQFEGR